jgi:hypothetical protein
MSAVAKAKEDYPVVKNLFLFFLMACSLVAQPEKPLFPEGKVILVPDLLRWDENYLREDPRYLTEAERKKPEKPENKNGEPPTLVIQSSVMNFTKTGEVRQSSKVDNNGMKTVTWYAFGYQAYKMDDATEWSTCPPDGNSRDFALLDWMTPETYVGTQKWEKFDCYYFKGIYKNLEVEAWIDKETRLPVFFRKGTSTWTYKYFPSPGAPLSIPREVEYLMKADKQRFDDLQRKPARS